LREERRRHWAFGNQRKKWEKCTLLIHRKTSNEFLPL
jgi:hypothetical protein